MKITRRGLLGAIGLAPVAVAGKKLLEEPVAYAAPEVREDVEEAVRVIRQPLRSLDTWVTMSYLTSATVSCSTQTVALYPPRRIHLAKAKARAAAKYRGV